MKRIHLFTLAAIALIATAFAPKSASQNIITIDYDSIASVVKERPEVFSALTARFMDADTTLSLQQMAIVYYGHAFTPTYDPNESYPEMMQAYNDDDMNLAIALGEQDLRRNPVSLTLLFKLYGACAVSEVPRLKTMAASFQKRLLMICDLISSSGLGVMPESPWCVISEGDLDEYLSKYVMPQRVLEQTTRGDEKAVKVKIDGIDDDVILYFDLVLTKNARK